MKAAGEGAPKLKTKRSVPKAARTTDSDALSKVIARYGGGPAQLTGSESALYERHLTFDNVLAAEHTGAREQYEAFARSVRDVLSQRWIQTGQTYERENPKRVYYLSMEFLIGRSLANNVINMVLDPYVPRIAAEKGLDWVSVLEQEPDAGLGNGGLGRLAACFLDSMATLQLPAMGYGLRYEYGIFRQSVQNGWQEERPDNWLRREDPWEVARPNEKVEIKLGCSFELRGGRLRLVQGSPSTLLGIPFDRPVVGYGGGNINTLRLWAAAAPDYFDFQRFSRGEFVEALEEKLAAESLTRVLYPDDSTVSGQALRLLQEYFLVACSLADLVRRFRSANDDWSALPDKVAIQLNDTHPALAVPELMRILLDEAHLGWDDAWELTRQTLAYTNHTLLPEALEKWPLKWFEQLLPRHLEIVFEINRRLLDTVRSRFPGDEGRVERVSLVEEGRAKQIRMANLAIVGSHSTNGVAAIHSGLLRTTTVKDLAETFPERFNNKTNGVTPRRWLLLANPPLARAVTDAIGKSWITDLSQLRKLAPFAADSGFRDAFRSAKRQAKARFAEWVEATSGHVLDPNTIIDSPRQAHSRIQAAVVERAARRGALQPATRERAARHRTAHVHLRGEGCTGVSAGQAGHQAREQRSGHHRRRPLGTRAPQGAVPARVLRVHGGTTHPGDRRLQPDLHRRLRGERHQQHEVHDEWGAHDRNARRGHDRDGRGGGRGQLFPVRPDRWPGDGEPRPVYAAVTLRHRTGDSSGTRSDFR